ncbi:MAG: carbohydrate ABC transporter permease [Oscillospiraceae bacterium]
MADNAMTQSVNPKQGVAAAKFKKFLSLFLRYLVLVIACLIVIVPIIYVLFGSFKTDKELVQTSAFALPKSFSLASYGEALSKGNVLVGFKNTAILIVVCCLGTVITGTMTAFVLDRFKTVFSKVVKAAFLFAVLLPNISMQVTVYQIMNNFNLVGTYWAPILLWVGTDIISIQIFVQFLSQIPVSLDESGIVDGASYPRIYWSIILPNLKPAIATVLTIKFVTIYNDFYTPKLYLGSDQPVVSTVLLNIMNQTTVSYSVVFAGVILCILPTLIIFLTLQKFIYAGLVSGAVKG